VAVTGISCGLDARTQSRRSVLPTRALPAAELQRRCLRSAGRTRVAIYTPPREAARLVTSAINALITTSSDHRLVAAGYAAAVSSPPAVEYSRPAFLGQLGPSQQRTHALFTGDMSPQKLLDAAGRPRSPSPMPGHHTGHGSVRPDGRREGVKRLLPLGDRQPAVPTRRALRRSPRRRPLRSHALRSRRCRHRDPAPNTVSIQSGERPRHTAARAPSANDGTAQRHLRLAKCSLHLSRLNTPRKRRLGTPGTVIGSCGPSNRP